MRWSEWLAVGYFAYVMATAVSRRWARRGRILAWSALALATVPAAARAAPLVRDWLSVGFLLAAYWIPVHFFEQPSTRAEARLLAFDRWLVSRVARIEPAGRGPRRVRLIKFVEAYLELAYLLCYLVVPGGLATLYAAGFHAHADGYWTRVFLASFPCYGLLPWVPTRPPRLIEQGADASAGGIRGLNLAVLGRLSNRVNTFPSGHAAASCAVALGVGAVMPAAGLVFGVVAASITIASVVRRYHYAADAILGVLLAFVAEVVVRF